MVKSSESTSPARCTATQTSSCVALYLESSSSQIFDDPLSAVDAQVGKMLFQNAIQGLVRSGKTVVLVTHALHFLPEVDYVYTLKNGRIAEEGTYDDLMNNGREFRVLMDQFGGFHGKEADHSTVPTAPEDNVDAETEAEADITDPLSSDHKQVAAWDTSKIAGTGTAKVSGRYRICS